MAIGAVAVALIAACWWEGGFAVRHWAIVAMFALPLLAGALAFGPAGQFQSRPAAVAVVAIWLFAAWVALSMTWSESPGAAWEDAGRTALYAAIASGPLVLRLSPWDAETVGWLAVAGVALLGLGTLAALYIDPNGWFVAGRLERPMGHASATGALFALAVWPFIAVTARADAASTVRCLALGGAVLTANLAFLSQSRGVLFALVAGGVVAIGTGPDRIRRLCVAGLLALAVAGLTPWLLDPYHAFTTPGGEVTAAHLSSVASVITAAVAASVLAGIALVRVLDRPWVGHPRALATSRVVLPLVATGLLVGAFVAGDVVRYAGDRVDEFRDLSEPSEGNASSRLGSLRGQRYDLWRISWEEFRSAPVLGVGAGSFKFDYYVDRRTQRNTSDPHSLPLKVLAESGAIGASLLALFFGGLAVAARRAWLTASTGARRAATGLGAGGVVILAHASIEWLWLMPGTMGLGILLLALAVQVLGSRSHEEPSPLRLPWRVASVSILAAAAAGIAALYVADMHLRSARAYAGNAPARQLVKATAAVELNPWSIPGRYLEASAHESLGEQAAARAALRDALEIEPRNFVTHALLGDLETRAGNDRVALAHYRRALRLNPLDTGLQELARAETSP